MRDELSAEHYAGKKLLPALRPYNSSQRDALKMERKMSATYEGTGLYLFFDSDGTTNELSVTEVQQKGVDIICNPFLTRFWPHIEQNMTLIPVKFACTFPRTHSWRRMLLTSPPITSLSMGLWYIIPFSHSNLLTSQHPLRSIH